jgi:Tetratricopeptide repeat
VAVTEGGSGRKFVGMVGEGTVSASSFGSRHQSDFGKGAGGKLVSCDRLRLSAPLCSGALQPRVLSLEDARSGWAFSTLPGAAFHRTLEPADISEWRFRVFTDCSAVFFRRRWPAGLAVWVFYSVLLLPVSGVVAFGPYAVADRFSYLPCLGWAILAGAGFFFCWGAWGKGRIGLRTLVLTPTLAVLLLLALGVLTWRQTQIWHDSERLWKHALAVDERSSFAHNNLGLTLAERGEFAEAIKHFRRAIEIDPASVNAQKRLKQILDIFSRNRVLRRRLLLIYTRL